MLVLSSEIPVAEPGRDVVRRVFHPPLLAFAEEGLDAAEHVGGEGGEAFAVAVVVVCRDLLVVGGSEAGGLRDGRSARLGFRSLRL